MDKGCRKRHWLKWLTKKLGILPLVFLCGILNASPIKKHSPLSNLHLGAQLGYGGMLTGEQYTSFVSQKIQGFTYRAYVSYLFSLDPKIKIGPELGFMGYPKNHYDVTFISPPSTVYYRYKGYTANLLGNMTYVLIPKLYIISKFGIAYVYQKLSFSSSTRQDNWHKRKIFPEFSLGLSYQAVSRLALTISYTRIMGVSSPFTSENYSQAATIDAYLFGVDYTFGC